MKRVLILAFLLFWMPVFFNQAPIFREDAAFISFPRLMACAGQVSKGSLPLWDNLTFCGARPFYASLDTPVYYLPLYPFMWLSGGKSADTVWYIAYVLPLALHILAAFFGAVLLFQMLSGASLGLSDKKEKSWPDKFALACGFIYSFSPVLIYSFRSLTSLFIFAWMPWALIYLLKALGQDPGKSAEAAHPSVKSSMWRAAFFTGLMLLAGDLNIAGRCIAFIFISAFIYSPGAFKRLLFILAGGAAAGLPAIIGQTEGLSRMAGLSSSINPYGVISPGLMDAAAWTCPAIFGVETEKSCYLSSWFFPVGHKIFLPGFFIFILLIMGLYFSFRPEKTTEIHNSGHRRPWFLALTTGLFIFAAFIPKLLLLLPPSELKKLPSFLLALIYAPQPIYWLFPAVLGASVISCQALKRFSCTQEIKPGARVVFLMTALFLSGMVLFSAYRGMPYISVDKKAVINRASNEYTKFDRIYTFQEWVSKGPAALPVICLSLAVVLLISSVIYAGKRYAAGERREVFPYFGSLLFIIFIAEYFFWAYIFLYRPVIYPELSAKGGYGMFFRKSAEKPSAHEYYSQAGLISDDFRERQGRFSGMVSDIDHLAWVTGVPSLSGYDCKPLFPPFAKVLVKAGLRPFYWMNTSTVPKSFLRNMGIRKRYSYSVLPNVSKSVVGQYRYYDSGYVKSLDLVSSEVPTPLDLVYFQENFEIASAEQCIEKTVNSDLGKRLVIEKHEYDRGLAGISHLRPNAFFEGSSSDVSRITPIMTESDRIILNVNISKDGFIVLNKCWNRHWKAFANDQSIPLLRLNSFMQGMYLKKGKYKIELLFRPYKIYFGFLISIMILSACIFFGIRKSLFSSFHRGQG